MQIDLSSERATRHYLANPARMLEKLPPLPMQSIGERALTF